MRSAIYILFVWGGLACSDGIDNDRGKVTVRVGDAESTNALQDKPQGTLPANYKKITFSSYAEVTAADVVEIVLLVDAELSAERKKQLVQAVDALLKPIINSHWRIAVADTELAAYPTKFITKYANYADYSKQFAAALGVDAATAQPQAHTTPAGQQQAQPAILRAFIIVTAQALSDTKLEENDIVLADKEAAHLTKVYAILGTEDGLDGYLNWTNAQAKHVLSRYASYQADYKIVLGQFAADIANTLRGIFSVPPHTNRAGNEDVAIAQLKVFNNPNEEEGQDAFIHASHYRVKKNIIFAHAKFVEGICVDVTLDQ